LHNSGAIRAAKAKNHVCERFRDRHRPPPGRRSAPPDGRLQRAIQYSEAAAMESRGCGVLDTLTALCGALFEN
jgi:hypothetical protein